MAEERVQRRLAAILAADVVGYSRLMEADEAGTHARLKALRAEMIYPSLEAHTGRVFKTTGDGILSEFPSAVDAVEHAVRVQRAMVQRNAGLPLDQRIEFRIGINIGDVIVDEGDVFGDGVNVAARLESLADAGGICVSGAVYDQVSNKTGYAFDDMGARQVKNIAKPIQVYRVVLDDSEGEVDARGSSPAAVLSRPALAVLPFDNLGGGPEQEYFADGLTEDIIGALSAWRSFPVIARNSTFIYKGKAVKVQQVAEELSARYVLEGSVRRGGSRVRISAQLIDAETGHHLWTERYDRELEDIFELQDEIAQRIAAIIEPELEKVERNRTVARQPMNLDAWDCYQRGMSFLYEFTRDGNAKAREMFEQAIALDPSYSQAYTGLAYTHHRDLFLGFAASRDETLAAFRQAARRAVALDERDSYAHWMLGLVYMWDGNFDLAVSHGERSVELNPSNSVSHVQLGTALVYAGRASEGVSYMERGLQLNPHDPRNDIYYTHLADGYLNTDRYDDAIEAARMAIRQSADFIEARLVSASALGHLGRSAEAMAELDECRRIDPEFADPSADWRRYRSQKNVDQLFEGLRKAGWEG